MVYRVCVHMVYMLNIVNMFLIVAATWKYNLSGQEMVQGLEPHACMSGTVMVNSASPHGLPALLDKALKATRHC